MILSFLFFMILFLGGFWLLGIAHELPDFQALTFCGGLLLVTLALAFVLRERGSATRRSKNWSGNPTE
ncbi:MULTISPECIES: hypothetical protein [Microbacterium]|uniref:LPXTG cell wall anchor domain-containing protein n=1 Tax=Microbacterium algeriense TaxID=2615184 RepID=A0ABQ6VAM0_9MICO|nr:MULTISPECIES: hypothetical protein [Microbacterium]AZH79297.1 hypothetical protein CSX12_13005 [Microbacterium sp. Y-01]KAB1867435.1 hypothetical protein F6A08_06565 [Microbacterium algeriense]MDX2399641.1 hypothetical protein [Microbacterium algeriense]